MNIVTRREIKQCHTTQRTTTPHSDDEITKTWEKKTWYMWKSLI